MKKLALLLAFVMLTVLAAPAALHAGATDTYNPLFDFSAATSFTNFAGDNVVIGSEGSSLTLGFWNGFCGGDSNHFSIVTGTSSSDTTGYDGIALRIRMKTNSVIALDIGGVRYNNAVLRDTSGNNVTYVAATDQNGVWLTADFDGYMFFPFSGATGTHNSAAKAFNLVFLQAGLADSTVTIDAFGAYKGTDYAAVIEAIDPTPPAPVPASLSPSTAAFDKAAPADIAVTLSPGSYSLTGLKNGDYTLVKDVDYTVSDNIYTIKAAYLASLNQGNAEITFVMDGGTSPVLTVAVTDTPPKPSIYKPLFDFSAATSFANRAGDNVVIDSEDSSLTLGFWDGFCGGDSNHFSIVEGTASSNTTGYDGIVLRVSGMKEDSILALEIAGKRYNNAVLRNTNGKNVEYVAATDHKGVWLIADFDGYVFFPFSGATPGTHDPAAVKVSLVFLQAGLAGTTVTIDAIGAYKGTDYAAVIADMNGDGDNVDNADTGDNTYIFFVSVLAVISAASLVLLKKRFKRTVKIAG